MSSFRRRSFHRCNWIHLFSTTMALRLRTYAELPHSIRFCWVCA